MENLLLKEEHDRNLEIVENPQKLKGLSDEELLNLKDRCEDLENFFNQMQLGVKLLCNSIYGGVSTNSLKYFNPETAADITAEGRNSNKMMEKVSWGYLKNIWPKDFKFHKELKEKFPKIFKQTPEPVLKDPTIYGDTDSNYLCFDYIFESIGIDPYNIDYKEANEFIIYFMKNKLDPLFDKVLKNKISERNGDSTMIFELESIGGFGIFPAKKKYVFQMLWDDGKNVIDDMEIKSTGIALAQKSVPIVARNFISFFIKHILRKKGKITDNEFYKICRMMREKLDKVDTVDFAKTNNMSKYSEYVLNDEDKIKWRPKCPVPIKGAIRYNRDLKQNNLQSKYPIIRDGMKVMFWYDKEGKPYSMPADSDFPKEFAPEMSRDIQIEKLVFKPIRRLVENGMIGGNLDNMGNKKITKSFSNLLK